MPNMPKRPLADALGLPPSMDKLYRQVLAGSGGTLAEIADTMFLSPDALRERLEPFIDADVVRLEGDVVTVASPVEAVSRYVAIQAAIAVEAGVHLSRLARAIPLLADMGGNAVEAGSTRLDGEIRPETDAPRVLENWIRESPGDVCFLRPDQWRLPSESAMTAAVRDAVQSGRRVRAIYPARTLQVAPAILIGRAAIGEQIRLLPDVPTRMALIGTSRAMLPEPLGAGRNQRLLLVRQPALVETLTAWFDYLWDSATAVPTLDRGAARPDLRRLLLSQLASGAKDEQIARTLDLSLRTVRRRIAGLLDDLGVDTRFQAGVEAARRGWL